jgi:hypothetical protein
VFFGGGAQKALKKFLQLEKPISSINIKAVLCSFIGNAVIEIKIK